MTKQRGPLLRTQAARTTKKTVLALAALLGLQAAALAYTAYDYGWNAQGDCWCSFSFDDPQFAQSVSDCQKQQCDLQYSGSQDLLACYHGGDDEVQHQIDTHTEPNCGHHGGLE